MTAIRLNRWLLTVICLLLLSGFVSGTAHAADPNGRLSQSILANQVSGPYEIELAGATFVDDSALEVKIEEIDGGAPPPEGTTVSFLLAPETDPAKQFTFTSEQEQAPIAAVSKSPGVWVLNPAPLDQEGWWKGRLLVDGPAGAESVGFVLQTYPTRPVLSPWITLSQPLVPVIMLGLALLVVRALRKPLLESPPDATESSPVPTAAPRTPTGKMQ